VREELSRLAERTSAGAGASSADPSPAEDAQPKSNIMMVDDQPANLKLLEELLTQQGHAVRSFPRGRLALDAAARNLPDLILLDIDMPEVNGFEVCERLKADDKLAHIPVLFLSALNETRDKVNAFRIEVSAAFAQSRGVALELEPEEAGCVIAKRDLLLKAMQALLETAVKFSNAGDVVRVKCQAVLNGVQVFIRGSGRIPESAIANFFQVFSIGEAITPGGDLGLGPPVSQRILSLFGGSITAENLEPSGIQLTVSLKAA
jgi:CheY-like chemotaxis protein